MTITQSPIYLDYMATTPLDPQVLTCMLPYLQQPELCGNPTSTHKFGMAAHQAVAAARTQVAQLINASAESIIFTSGATEAINLALKGAAQFHQRKGKHIITSQIEHKAVLDCCEFLSQQGFEVEYLKPSTTGIITPQQIQAALREDTIMVAVMAANNEIGTLNDIAAIGNVLQQHGALFVVDAAQAVGKIPLDCQTLNIDLLAISSHKLYGPKGVGALYIRRKPRVRISPQMHGGGHENGLRSGTLPTHQIVGFGAACELAGQQMLVDIEHARAMQQRFWNRLNDLPQVSINGDIENRLANNLNLCFQGIDAEALLTGLPQLAISTASACNSIVNQASYVLKAIGLSDLDAFSSLRVSFGRFTTAAEVDAAASILRAEVIRLRQIAPG